MRASVSLTSFFSSLRSPTASSHHFFIPLVRIVSPTEPASPRLAVGPGGIRRWRGALGALGDFRLQLPSQGLTSGARLALARQGCATGSFRLNCSESLYVKDSQGLAMFQRIELDEELDKARLGLRERPPMLAATKSDFALVSNEELSLRCSKDGYCKPRRPSLRTQRKHALAVQNMRFDSSGLSSCATFTEGLCNLEDYVRAGEADSSAVELPTIHSEKDVALLSSAENETPRLSWLDSLKRKTFSSSGSSSTVKKRRSAGELVKSLSCIESSFSETELTLIADHFSPILKDALQITEKHLETTFQPEDEKLIMTIPKGLQREGSWSKLRRRFSAKITEKQIDFPNEPSTVQRSISVASGLFQILEEGMPICVSSLHACV